MDETNKIPSIFLGTAPLYLIGEYRFKRIRTINAVKNGITRGYGIDCAVAYDNHRQVRRGITVSGKKRKEIFITSKLYNTQQDKDIKRHYKDICDELGVEYLDLLLLHWPQKSTYLNAWKQMVELYNEKKVKYIGISNVEIKHLMEMENICGFLPHVIQIERNPLYTRNDIISFCHEKGIIVQAYAPLGRMNEVLMKQKILNQLANKYGKGIPQIILKWHIQTGVCPVVRSVRKRRIIENINIWDFELTDEEIQEITKLNQNYRINDPRKFCRYY